MKCNLLRRELKMEDEMIQNTWTSVLYRTSQPLRSIGHVRLAISGLLLATLAACGGSVTGSPQAASEEPTGLAATEESPQPAAVVGGDANFLAALNPCELLTPAELESFFGEPAAADAAPEDVGPYRSCMFTNETGGKLIILQITHESPAQFEVNNEGSAAMLEVIPTPVSGLGDELVFFSGLLRVRTGDVVTQVVTWHPEAEQAEAFTMTQEIARLAIGRLP